MGLVPGPVAVKTKKAKKMMIQEMIYRETRGASADYEHGRKAWDESILEARKAAYNARNERARRELEKYGII